MYRVISLHPFAYFYMILIKKMWQVTKAIAEIISDTEQTDKIGVTLQCWVWVWVELIAWYVSWLEQLNWIQWLWVQIPLRPTLYSHFKELFSSEYHMNQVILPHPCYYLHNVLINKTVATDEGNSRNEMWDWTKRRNWSSCTRLALDESWTHDLIAHSVGVTEQNSVVVGLNLTQVKFF